MTKWMEDWNWPKVVAFGLAIAVVSAVVYLGKDDVGRFYDFVVQLVTAARGGAE